MNPSLPRTLKAQSPAKVNLFLHITGRRPNGYHNLESIFCPVSLFDDIEITLLRTDTPGLRIARTGPLAHIPEHQDLCVRAANAYLRKHPEQGFDLHLQVNKRIPEQAGLGGGSSNAATVLQLLQSELGWYTPAELLQLALPLGADVPFFMQPHSAFVEGIGECITPLQGLEAWFLVYKPTENCPTAEIFASQQLTRNSESVKIAVFDSGGLPKPEGECLGLAIHGVQQCTNPQGLVSWLNQHTFNCMQTVVQQRLPSWQLKFEQFKQLVQAQSPSLVRMSGSGSAWFAMFSTAQQAHQAVHNVALHAGLQTGRWFVCSAL